ncbi:TPA: sel1 repeat family protein [Providencia rettgeri]|nr:sel1 repeat family protein [Providencia rettgeri]
MKKTAIVLLTFSLCLPALGANTQQQNTNPPHTQITNDLENLYQEGWRYSNEGKFDLAEQSFLKAAKQNHLKSQESLALHYYFGKNGKVNYRLAGYWFHQAAGQGSARAEFTLGTMYIDGAGFPKDVDFGIFLINKAKVKGYKPAEEYIIAFEKLKDSCRQSSSKECDITVTPQIGW